MAVQMKKEKFGLSAFWIFYLIFVAVMVIFWVCAAGYVRKGLIRFEASQPENTVERFVHTFQEDSSVWKLPDADTLSRFETQENYAAAFAELLADKTLWYRQAPGYQDPSAPTYELCADEKAIGTVRLKELSAEPFMKLLTISEWGIDTVEFLPISADRSVEITVPEHYQVSLNGTLMDEREQDGTAQVSEEFAYVAEYVEVPRFVVYRTDGLYEKPEIIITASEGEAVPFEESVENGVVRVELLQFMESEMPAELSEMALTQVEQYTNFFSADLPGCHSSVAPLKTMFPENSYYLEMAETYRKEDMWMYSDHAAPVFKDEVVDHYIRYHENLFSCEVSFTKEMLLTKWNSMREDKVHFKVYYGMVNNSWKILDIQTILVEKE